MKKPHIFGVFGILVGILLILLSRVLFASLPAEWLSVLRDVLKDVGVAVILFGVLNVMVDLPEWRQYFEERIKAIVIQQDYLRSLDSGTLLALGNNVTQARLKLPGLGDPGTLLYFLNENIDRFLTAPYQEDVRADVTYSPAATGTLKVRDRVTFTCKAVGGKIKEKVSWKGGEAAFREVLGIKLTLTYPPGHLKAGVSTEALKTGAGERKLEFDLTGEYNVDGLKVELLADYVIDELNQQYWKLPDPCKGVEVRLTYPTTYEATLVDFAPLPSNAEYVVDVGKFDFRYSGWTFPNSGCVWQLRAIKQKETVAPAGPVLGA
jgi:hypothetical protein